MSGSMANTNFFILCLSKENQGALCFHKDRILEEGIHCLDKLNMISLIYENEQLLTELPGGYIWHRIIEFM